MTPPARERSVILMFGLFSTVIAFVGGVVFAVPVTTWWNARKATLAASAASAAASAASALVADVKKAL